MTQSINPRPANLPGQALVERLSRYDFDREELASFAGYLNQASEIELHHLNPRRAAEKAEIDLRRALEISATGTREGIFDLHWEVGCTGCNAPVTEFDNLSKAPGGEVICPVCGTHNSLDASHNVRVYFSVNPTLCKINPAITAFTVPPNIQKLALEDYFSKLPSSQREILQELMQLINGHPAVTALDLLHVQIFRDFFKEQTLPVDVSMKVTRVALLFTDLRGSTAMYAAKGDPQAYSLVRKHFELLAGETTRHGGVIIKTIGDAIMASFLHEINAARAAVAFHQAISRFNRENKLNGPEALLLKTGLHAGACISVNQNGIMDYFGTTVNMAARIAGLSHGGDIVVSQELLKGREVQQAFLAGGFTPQETQSVTLRGLPYPTEVTRLGLAASDLSTKISKTLPEPFDS